MTDGPIPYSEFRTGLTFAEVRSMLWVDSPDPKDWKYKRRGTVLGTWRAIKQQLYARYVEAWNNDTEERFDDLEEAPWL